MPALVGMGLPRVSELVVDADLTIPAAYKIVTKKIQSLPGAALYIHDEAGVASLNVSNIGLAIEPARGLYTNRIREWTASHRVEFPNGIKTDVIDDAGGAIVTVLEDFELDTGKYIKAASAQVDTITDRAYSGMPSFLYGLKTDHIAEYTGAHGIVFDDTVLMTTLTTMLSQMFRTATVSNTLRKSLDTETYLANGGDGFVKISSDITIPVNYVGSGNDFRIKFDGYDTGSGGLPKMAVFVNGVQVGVDHNTGGAYVTYNDDINNLKAGDTIAIYCNPNGMVGGRFYLRNFRLYCDDTVSNVLGSYTWT